MLMSTTSRTTRARRSQAMARGLGWFSIGLGVAELLAPKAMSRATGLRGRERVVQAYGLREIATGAALLRAKDPTPWLWARVAGDVLDMATLGREGRPSRRNTALALAAVAGATALDIMAARSAQAQAKRRMQPMHDYSDRSGFPKSPQEMRGAALKDFEKPEDMRTPEALAPYSGA